MAPHESEEFTVKVGAIARTLEYDDEHVHIRFTFDVGSKGKKSLCLEHHAPHTPRSSRYAIAFERTKPFLEQGGYEVEIHGE